MAFVQPWNLTQSEVIVLGLRIRRFIKDHQVPWALTYLDTGPNWPLETSWCQLCHHWGTTLRCRQPEWRQSWHYDNSRFSVTPYGLWKKSNFTVQSTACWRKNGSVCISRPPVRKWLPYDSMVMVIIITLRPRRNGQHFADDIFKRIFFNENVWISLKISLTFVLKVRINNIPALGEIMTWRRPGDKPLSEPVLVSLLTHICVIRPQWVMGILNQCDPYRPLLTRQGPFSRRTAHCNKLRNEIDLSATF